MAAARTQRKITTPASPNFSTNSARFTQQQSAHLQDDDTFKGASSTQPLASSKPTTPLGFPTRHHPRSRFSREEDDDEEATHASTADMWEQSQGPYITSSRSGKRTPDSKQYLSYTMCAANKVSRFPGPGSYNANLKSGGPSFSMGSRTSLRSADRSYAPGPGTYNVRIANSGPSFSMGPKVRLPVTQQDLNPGPGTYSDLSSAFGRRLSFSIRDQFK